MNGKASLLKSMSVTSLSSLRLFGPDRVMVAQWSVTEVKYTFMSGHSVWWYSSSHCSTRAAPPVVVVMTKWLSARQAVTPSSKTMPSSLHIRP
ncbi:hypothetical protein D3C80_900460 [compost metagenome]